MGACTQSRNFFIVSEYLPGGDVEKLLHDPKVELSLYQRMTMAKDAALGMNWLHCSNPNVIHRDLKTSNLLIDENGRVKVCDFGLSQLKTPGEDLKDGDSAKGTVRDHKRPFGFHFVFQLANLIFNWLNRCFSLVGTRVTFFPTSR